jgi:hypothetical protein
MRPALVEQDRLDARNVQIAQNLGKVTEVSLHGGKVRSIREPLSSAAVTVWRRVARSSARKAR